MSLLSTLNKIIIPQSDSAREKWISSNLARLKKGGKILDAGAGECYYQKYCGHLKYVSQDFNGYDGKGDKKGIQTGKRDVSQIDIVSDIVKMPIDSSSFDNVLCVEVFEHIPDPLSALKEMSRVTKKGGTLILTAPFSSLVHYSPFYYYSGFSKNFYKDTLPKYNFKIEEIYVYGNYFDWIALEIARTPLVLWRMIKFWSLPIIFIYLITAPAYIMFRTLGTLIPSSSDLLAFGVCIKAKKI